MALAEDIVHDVFIKAQSKSDQLKEANKATGWIYQIAKNTIIDHFRKQAKSIEAAELDWENEAPNFNECVSNCLKDLLPKLPEKYRQAIELTELENLSQLQLAEQLGISYSGAKSRVQRARQMLKEKMNEVLIIKTDAYGNVIVCVDRPGCC